VRSAAFRYITDAITKEEALAMLKEKEAGKKEREAKVRELGQVIFFVFSRGLILESLKIPSVRDVRWMARYAQ